MSDLKIINALNRLSQHYGPQSWWQSDNRVHDLISMVLIQRTTERNAKLAMEAFAADVILEELLAMPLEDLQEMIRPAGFFTSKVQTIQTLADFLLNQEEDSLANMTTVSLREHLLALKGIGPETADVILLYYFGRKVFVADEYARRLFARLGFGDYASYDQLKKASQGLVDAVDLATCQEWHAVIDEHGKEFRRLKGDLDESWLLKD